MMNLGLVFLLGILVYLGIFFSYQVIRSLMKKTSFLMGLLDIDNVFKTTFFLVLFLIFSLIIHFSYSRALTMSFVWLAIATALVAVVVPFKSLFIKIKNRQFKEISPLKALGFLGPILLLILEVGVFSNVASKKDNGMVAVPFDSALILKTDGVKDENGITFEKQRQYIILDNSEKSIKSLYLDLSSDIDNPIQVDIFVSTSKKNEYSYKKSYRLDPNFSEFEYINVKDYSHYEKLKIVFVIDETNFYNFTMIPKIHLHEIVINKAFPFVFNMARFTLLVIAYSLLILTIKKGRDLKYSNIDKIALLQKVVLILCGVGLIYIIVNSLIYASTQYVLVKNVTGLETSDNIYYQLFIAFKNGHLYLDFPVEDEFKAIANPYDPSNRNGMFYLWDHAYYHGKYYCYYGCAPVLLVMFPIYLLSGLKYIPSLVLLQQIGVLFSILTFSLLALETVKVMMKKVNYPVLVFAFVGVFFSSLLMSNVTQKVGYYSEGIYRVPYSYGLCFYFLALLMLLKAYKNDRYRMVYLGITALAVVLMMASRPTLLVGMIVTIPLFIMLLLRKNLTWKKKIIDFIPMVAVLAVGAFFICLYNYLRFDSIFEFGQSYQLTVTDNTKLAYSEKGIIPTLYHFFVLPPSLDSKVFPYVNYGYSGKVQAYHTYNSGAIGLFFFPVFLSMFSLPFIFDKEDDLGMRIMYYLAPAMVFFLAFTTYCFAGVCPRYVVELTAVMGIFSFVPLLKLFDKLYTNNKTVALIYLSVATLLSIFVGVNLLFASFDGWREADQHGLLEVFKSIFNNYNI